jgi:hypothetical protein
VSFARAGGGTPGPRGTDGVRATNLEAAVTFRTETTLTGYARTAVALKTRKSFSDG